MRAVVCTGLGGREVLEERDVPAPEPGPEDLLVEVLAAGLNPVDFKIRETGLGVERSAPFILGYDVCGVVRDRGAAVVEAGGFEPGSRVIASPSLVRDGANAELVCVDARTAAVVPDHLRVDELAALPLAAITAWEALFERARLRDGDTCVVLGGAGGVGHLAIQFARERGARVLATAGRDESIALCEGLGAEVVDYRGADATEALVEATGGGADIVFDTVGGDVFEQALDVVGVDGRLVTVLPTPSPRLADALFLKNVSLHYEFMGVPGIYGRRRGDQGAILAAVSRLLAEDRIRPVVAGTYPLAELAAAHAELEGGHVHGKLVIEVGAS